MDYRKGKVYRIDCLVTGEVYIGSTCQATLAKRLAQHVSECKRWKSGKKVFVSSYPIIERDNYKISLVELIQCNSRDELIAREGFYIRTLDCVNKRIAGRTKKEYDAEHSELKKEYYQVNKIQITEHKKEYYQVNKIQITEQAKEYYETNRIQISEQRKGYYEANKIKILEQKKEYHKANQERRKQYYQANKDEVKTRTKELREQKQLEKLKEKSDH